MRDKGRAACYAALHVSPGLRFMRKHLFSSASCLLLLWAASLLQGCHKSTQPAGSAGLTKVILQADWYPQPEHGGFYTGLVKGYYKDEGLDLAIQPGGPYTTVGMQG